MTTERKRKLSRGIKNLAVTAAGGAVGWRLGKRGGRWVGKTVAGIARGRRARQFRTGKMTFERAHQSLPYKGIGKRVGGLAGIPLGLGVGSDVADRIYPLR